MTPIIRRGVGLGVQVCDEWEGEMLLVLCLGGAWGRDDELASAQFITGLVGMVHISLIHLIHSLDLGRLPHSRLH